jgi:hypothetical protein
MSFRPLPYKETQLVRCSLERGVLKFYFDGFQSENVPSSASTTELKHILDNIPSIGHVDVSYSIGSRLCSFDGSNVVTITFLDLFGPLPPLTCDVMDSYIGNSSSFVEIKSAASSFMTDGLGRNFMTVKGSKDNFECSNRGICNLDSGICTCFDGHEGGYGPSDGHGSVGQRDDCGFVTTTVSDCPMSCNGRGFCNKSTYTCTCPWGYHGPDCSLRNCPRALSWFANPSLIFHQQLSSNFYELFHTECSDMGVCNRNTGECSCKEGFAGASCEHMLCTGTVFGRKTSCSGHGQCLSMRQLAHRNKLNGTAFPHEYGTDPFSSSTWDADRIFGCICDEGYYGFDCSIKTRP